MKTLRLMPEGLNRSIAVQDLAPNQARTLQFADVATRPGKLQRLKGAARNQVTASSSTVTASGSFKRQDGKVIVVDGNTGGTVRMTPGDGSVNGTGPLPEWNDTSSAET